MRSMILNTNKPYIQKAASLSQLYHSTRVFKYILVAVVDTDYSKHLCSRNLDPSSHTSPVKKGRENEIQCFNPCVSERTGFMYT